MTKKIIFIVFCMVSALASAQHRFPPIDLYTGDPTGVACTVPNSMVQSTTSGGIYACVGGFYVNASGGTAYPGVTSNGAGLNMAGTLAAGQAVLNQPPVTITAGGADIAVQINAALANSAICPADGSGYQHCQIILPYAQSATWGTTVTITSPYVSLIGMGQGQSKFSCTVNGDCLRIYTSPFTTTAAGNFQGFAINGTATANGVGIHLGEIVGAHFHDLNIGGFGGTNGIDLWMDNQYSGWTERNLFTKITLGIAPTIIRTTVESGTNSFGYNRMLDMRINSGGGTVFSLQGVSYFYNGTIRATINSASGATIWHLQDTAQLLFEELHIDGEMGGGAAYGNIFDVCSTCAVDYVGNQSFQYASSYPSNIAAGATFHQTFGDYNGNPRPLSFAQNTNVSKTLIGNLGTTPFVSFMAFGEGGAPSISGNLVTFNGDGSNNGGAITTVGVGGDIYTTEIASTGGTAQTFDLTSQISAAARAWFRMQANGNVGVNTPGGTFALFNNGSTVFSVVGSTGAATATGPVQGSHLLDTSLVSAPCLSTTAAGQLKTGCIAGQVYSNTWTGQTGTFGPITLVSSAAPISSGTAMYNVCENYRATAAGTAGTFQVGLAFTDVTGATQSFWGLGSTQALTGTGLYTPNCVPIAVQTGASLKATPTLTGATGSPVYTLTITVTQMN